jgi:lipopolysaccharide export LptBFGC system permease protein LptF
MRRFLRIVGSGCLALAVVLLLIGITTLPSGGLMFALPYVFFIPGAILLAAGLLMRRAGRDPGA